MKKLFAIAICCIGLLAFSQATWAQPSAPQDKQESKPESEPESESRQVTVAVLSFEATDPGNPDMGAQLSEMATVALSGNAQFSLVDRTSLEQALGEAELNLTGMVEAHNAIKIGKLVGAKILVTGRAFRMGSSNIITAKLIGTETTRVEAVMVKGSDESDLAELAMELAEKIDARIVAKNKILTGQDIVQKDPLPELIATLKKRKEKPVVAIVVTEEHIAGPRPVPVGQPLDPAVETELKKVLGAAGFEIQDVPQNELAQWADGDAWPKTLEGVDFVITGEALSEFGSRIGNLINVNARAEINLISRDKGKIVVADRTTTRAVDLSENIAGKTALQKAGANLAVPILNFFASEKE